MAPEANPRAELISILRQQICEREDLRDKIERSIRVLQDAERELQRNTSSLVAPEPEPREPSGTETAPASAGAASEALEHLDVLLDRIEHLESLQKEQQEQLQNVLQGVPPREPILSEDSSQATAGPVQGPEKPGLFTAPVEEEEHPVPSTEAPTREEATPAETVRSEAAGAAAEASPPTPIDTTDLPGKSTERLLAYIRRGGSIRCLDPWGQLCTAFVLPETGPAIFATDAFLTYYRKTFRRLHQLREEILAQPSTPSGPCPKAQEIKSRKKFLHTLTNTLTGQKTEALRNIPGLNIIESGKIPTPSEFEFERITKNLMNREVLKRFGELMDVSTRKFFQTDGAASELAQFLKAYGTFARDTREEDRTAALLGQIGVPPAPVEPSGGDPDKELVELSDEEVEEIPTGAQSKADPNALSSFSASLYEESETLQDLGDFNFNPDDVAEILSQEEDPFSASGFRFENEISPTESHTAEESGRTPAPATSPGKGEQELVEIDEFEEELDHQASANPPFTAPPPKSGEAAGAPAGEDIQKILDPEEAEIPLETSLSANPMNEPRPAGGEKTSEREIKELLKDMGVEWD